MFFTGRTGCEWEGHQRDVLLDSWVFFILCQIVVLSPLLSSSGFCLALICLIYQFPATDPGQSSVHVYLASSSALGSFTPSKHDRHLHFTAKLQQTAALNDLSEKIRINSFLMSEFHGLIRLVRATLHNMKSLNN